MRALAAAAVALALLGACTASGPREPAPVTFGWHEATLPVPAGIPGRLALRDGAACAGAWYIVGGVVAPDGASRPAAWASADGVTWRVLALAPVSYYGHQNILYSAACHGAAFAAIGAKSGGVHGNPRVSTWYLRGDGVLAEVTAAFTLYGGGNAVNVARMAAGPVGWLIAGNRISGAAVWLSADATEFRLIEGEPALAADAGIETAASDAVGEPDGWTVVGGGTPTGRIDRDPLVWTSPDGLVWRRVPVPGDGSYEELQRVATVDGRLLAVGLRGGSFGAWRRVGPTPDAGWQPAGRFGATGGAGSAFISGLVVVGGTAVATASEGGEYRMWVSRDHGESWRRGLLPGAENPANRGANPREHPSEADRALTVRGAAGRLLVLSDDARNARVWWATYPD